jgi:hypothetical protein
MLAKDPTPHAGLSKQAITGKRVAAEDLKPGMKIYDVQIEGERLTRKTPAPIVKTWQHGPCTTIDTTRGAVEYDAEELVRVKPMRPADIIDAVVFAMQVEIRSYIAVGIIPVTVSSFSELHDYIDANMLAEEWYDGPTDDESEDEAEARMSANVAIFNPASNRVSAWLAAGRPEF